MIKLEYSRIPGYLERAEALLDNILNSDNIDIRPNMAIFNAGIGAWSCNGKEKTDFRAKYILNMLEDMENPRLREDTNSFNSTISAWKDAVLTNPWKGQNLKYHK